VAFYEGTPDSPGGLLGVGLTESILLPGAGEWVTIAAGAVHLAGDERFSFFAAADDHGSGVGAHAECHEDNNASAAASVSCMLI
jgi:hypothetical protein